MGADQQITNKGIFVTGTDTGVGKTVATLVLATLFQDRGVDVGVFKPVQCGGDDAQFLKDHLNLPEPLHVINPYFAPDPLAPHVAFKRAKMTVGRQWIRKTFYRISDEHPMVFVEGAGGLRVPISRRLSTMDIARDTCDRVIVVARLGLGTINHTLLTIDYARSQGLKVCGVLFCEAEKGAKGVAELTNPAAVRRFGEVPVLGTIPFLRNFDRSTILRRCRGKIQLERILPRPYRPSLPFEMWDKDHLWHPFTQMREWTQEHPLIIDKGDKVYLEDTKGRQYIDGVSSLWVNVHGHKHPRIDRAVKRQVDRLSHSTLLGLGNTPSIKLAKRLADIAPEGLTKVFYSDSGSTAVEIALKMAYQYWQNTGQKQKKRIVHLGNSYHGDTLGSVSVGGIDLFHKVYRDLVFSTIQVDFPDGCRAPKGMTYREYCFRCCDNFERLIKRRSKEIACAIVEPIVQGAAGMIVWPKGVLKRMWDACRKNGVIFIADEVATGFGRTGKMFACEHENVRPDILCLAKGLTGGYLPLAATMTTDKIYEGFLFDYRDQKTFFHGHSYTGNPLGCAAALANLNVFEKERTLEKMRPKIRHLAERLREFRNLPYVGDVRQKGMMVGIELMEDKRSKRPFAWDRKMGARVCLEIRKKGVILRPLGNVIVIMPPLSISIQDLDQILDAAWDSIKNIPKIIAADEPAMTK